MGWSNEWKVKVWTDDPIEFITMLTEAEAAKLLKHDDVELINPSEE